MARVKILFICKLSWQVSYRNSFQTRTICEHIPKTQGFRGGSSANPLGVANLRICNFFRKTHKIENSWVRRVVIPYIRHWDSMYDQEYITKLLTIFNPLLPDPRYTQTNSDSVVNLQFFPPVQVASVVVLPWVQVREQRTVYPLEVLRLFADLWYTNCFILPDLKQHGFMLTRLLHLFQS